VFERCDSIEDIQRGINW